MIEPANHEATIIQRRHLWLTRNPTLLPISSSTLWGNNTRLKVHIICVGKNVLDGDAMVWLRSTFELSPSSITSRFRAKMLPGPNNARLIPLTRNNTCLKKTSSLQLEKNIRWKKFLKWWVYLKRANHSYLEHHTTKAPTKQWCFKFLQQCKLFLTVNSRCRPWWKYTPVLHIRVCLRIHQRSASRYCSICQHWITW